MPKKFEDVKADLFEAIYLVVQPTLTPEQKDEVVSILISRGHDMVWNAIRQHLQKLRKKEGGDGAAGAAGNGTPKTAATPKTPRKRAPAKPKDGTKTPASKGKRKSEAVAKQDDDDDEMDDIPLSSKKLKSEPSVSDNSMDSFIKFDEDDDAGAV